ncbi:unnamed protein product [Acanthosepion pharaonis]|uniref:Uncharacterized protein n=1 Tax=Acanthosepion pharaonis TaxID=158019 RepID=A0A812DEQ4_ACAPH|nr:unnamed protein product [Sepia pharaonis]
MRSVDEGMQIGLAAEMRVDRGEVGDPIAVMPLGISMALGTLDGLVFEDWPQPDRRRRHGRSPLCVGSKPVISGPPFQAAAIIGGVAILEPVGQDEARSPRPAAGAGDNPVASGRRSRGGRAAASSWGNPLGRRGAMRGEEGVVRRQPAGHLCGVTHG